MGHSNGVDYELVIQKAVNAIELNKNYEFAIKNAETAFSIARNQDDLSKQIWATYIIALASESLENYENALSKYSWIISQVENNASKIDLNEWRTSTSVLTSFGHWTHCAIKLPHFFNKEAVEIIEAGEKFASNNGLTQWKPELLHAKSIALKGLKLFQEALIAAEEGLVFKKANINSPGCGLDHHLSIYSQILEELGREEDAKTVLDEAIEKYPWDGDLLEARGHAYFSHLNFDAAIIDLTEAIFLSDKETNSLYKIKGLCLALINKKNEAAKSLKLAHQIDPQNIYSALWLAGITGDLSFLPECTKNDKWLSNVAKYYLNELNEDELIKTATKENISLIVQKENLCEAYAYIGLNYERYENLKKACYFYRMCLETGIKNFYEYTWSKARLQELNL